MTDRITQLTLFVVICALAGLALTWQRTARTVTAASVHAPAALILPDSLVLRALPVPPAEAADPFVKLIGKMVITSIFGIAALFVVLSRRYDTETKKWAFSILTLIAGVWLGSAT
jgi:hypothetical protein